MQLWIRRYFDFSFFQFFNFSTFIRTFASGNGSWVVCFILFLTICYLMILQKISILNYKNIGEASLELSPKMNCLVGHNGEGKTNFLDAVYYLSFCRSAFTAIDSVVMKHDAPLFVLEGTYQTASGETEHISCGMKRGTKKHFKRNGKEYRRLSQHIGLVPLIMVSPGDTLLVEGGGDERRRLMDVVISQYDNTYIDTLNRYNKALQQRNVLLRGEQEPDAALMGILEEQMAAEGEVLFEKRTAFTRDLIPVFDKIYRQISGDRERASLRYVSHGQRGPLLDVIRRDRAKDRAVGYSLHGVHRDDLEMMLGDYALKREGSQGQNKSFVIALKLAQFAFLKERHGGNTPILLLDDVFDKLDARRVEQIIRLVAGDEYGQIFITDTNRGHLDRILGSAITDYKLFAVEDGEIKTINNKQ